MKTKIFKTATAVLLLTALLSSCSKEKLEEKRIVGKWKTVSLKRNLTETMNIWQEYPFSLNAFSCPGGKVYCKEKWILTSFIWEINKDGTAKQITSSENLDTDDYESKQQCQQVYKPQYTDNSSSDYTWELTENNNKFILKWDTGLRKEEISFEVLELSKKTIRLRYTDSAGVTREYKLEEM